MKPHLCGNPVAMLPICHSAAVHVRPSYSPTAMRPFRKRVRRTIVHERRPCLCPFHRELCETLVHVESRSGLFLATKRCFYILHLISSFHHLLLLVSHLAQGFPWFCAACSIPLIIAPNALDDIVGSPSPSFPFPFFACADLLSYAQFSTQLVDSVP
jgi:hypothetical protein